MGAVVVFARAPESGRVKTRLASTIGPERALQLYEAFLSDTLLAARRTGALVLLSHTEARPFDQQKLADESVPQRGDTFGARWDAAMADARAIAGPDTPLVLIGADSPHVAPSVISGALGELDRLPAVIGPCDDGGFYLLGFRSRLVPLDGVFGEPERVAERAVHRISATLGPPAVARGDFDVDTPTDLEKLTLHLSTLRGSHREWIPPTTSTLLLGDADAGRG